MLTVLYRDKDLVVAVKPAGLPSQPDPTGDADMLTLLSAEIGQKLYLLHRLDRTVGGVMAFAVTAAAAAKFSAAMAEGGAEKTYFAVVEDGKLPAAGDLSDFLYHDKKKGKSFAVTSLRTGVKEASLSYTTVVCAGGFALLRVVLHTGRFHQIRCQLASRGAPIYGDGKYGSRQKGGIGLFSHALTLPTPGGERRVTALPDVGTLPWQLFADVLIPKED